MHTTTTAPTNKTAILNSLPRVSPPKKSASDVPLIEVDETTRQKACRVATLKVQIGDLAKEQDILATDLKVIGENARRIFCKSGREVASVKIPNDGLGIIITTQNRYSVISIEREPDLRAKFNGQFERYFHTDSIPQLAPNKASAESLALLARDGAITAIDLEKASPEALTRLAQDNALALIETLHVTDALHHDLALDDNLLALAISAGIKPVQSLAEAKK